MKRKTPMPVRNRLAEMQEDIAAWRRDIHAHPELLYDTHRTAALVAAKLQEFGCDEVTTGIGRTGVVGVIRGRQNTSGRTVGLRADMDALPILGATGAAHASTVAGKMHACGHDGHTAMLLGAAKYLCETRAFRGKVILVFQPAEETIGGGRLMVEDGIFDRHGVEEVFALHTDPFAELGVFRTNPGSLMAAVDDYALTVRGKGGHAAYPHECRDPMPCAVAIAQALQALPRSIDPLDSVVVALTQFHGGTAPNVIPDAVTLGGTVRSLTPAVRDRVEQRIAEIVAGAAAMHGVEAELDYRRNYPPTVNHPEQTGFAVEVAREVSGKVVDDMPPEMGAEDFSYMLEARPGSFLFLGQGLGPSVHHPEFDFNDDAAVIGASFFARLVERRHA